MPPPIFDTHVHLYQVTRPGGVEWPPRGAGALDRDHLAADYEAVARPLGVAGAVVVEASPNPADNRWVLDHVAGNPFFRALVAELDVDAPDVMARLAALVDEPRVVGVRAFLWSGAVELDDEQLSLLRALAAAGMTLDLVSRGEKNPKAGVVRLARAVPQLRIIVDHLAGAVGREPSPEWTRDVRSLAACPNVSLKLSGIFDMHNPGPNENVAWESPLDAAAYAPHFELALESFGAERVLFGSNWPVTEMSSGLASEIGVVERWLAPLGRALRDRVMWRNAEEFYVRKVPA